MTDIMVPWPEMPGALVVARFAQVHGDGSDDDDRPDWIAPAGAELMFIPSITGPLVYDPTGAKIIVEVSSFRAVVNADGYAVSQDGGHPIRLAPTNDALMSRTGWLWTCSWEGGKVSFPAPSEGAINLADYIIAPPGNPVVKEWIGRIPELVDATGNLVGVESITSDADDMVVTLTNGEVHRLPMPPGVPGPATDLTLGDVSTGDLAAASISGTAPNLVLDLVLPPGPSGLSAYEVAVSAGFTGSATEWLESLKGEPGDHGIGIADVTAVDGIATITLTDDTTHTINLPPGPPGHSPVVGLSGDRLTVDGVPVGGSLRGPAGPPGGPGAVATQSSYLIVGPGRPDMPETTGGIITGKEPTGAEYRSTDGPQGAWVWVKKGAGSGIWAMWTVTHGDTGFRGLYITDTWPEYYGDARLFLRRVNETVTLTSTNSYFARPGSGGVANAGAINHQVPVTGFTPRSNIFAEIYDGTDTRVGTAEAFSWYSELGISLHHDAVEQVFFQLRWDTGDRWPTTLPGYPA